MFGFSNWTTGSVFSPVSESTGSDPQSGQLRKLTVNIFLAGFIWPLWVGQEKNFFAKNGLDIQLISTPNSLQQMAGLIDGAFDIAMTAIDNVIAYMEGQGEAPTKSQPDIVSVMGSSNGFLSLIVAPHIRTVADLKGTTLSVDAMTTGYAFTLRKMLEMNGLNESDYTLVAVGGMKERYEALLAGNQVGTLLVPPFTICAQDKGFTELTTVLRVFKHFQGGIAAVRRKWATDHRNEIVDFISGYLTALAWLYDPVNKQEALDIFTMRLPGTSQKSAEQSYKVLLHSETGFSRDASIDIEGVQTIIDIRKQFAKPYNTLSEPQKYYDLAYFCQATN